MLKKILIGVAILIVATAAAWFLSYSPLTYKQPTPVQKADNFPTETPPPTPTITGEDAIKKYAAEQFNVPVQSLKVISSKRQEWKDTCMELNVNDKTCKNEVTQGYEMTFEITGQQITYRGNDAGTSIRIVKK